MESANNMKWMSFSGLQNDLATWSTRFAAFAKTEKLHDTLVGTEEFPEAPRRLGENASAEDRQEHWRLTQKEQRHWLKVRNVKPNLVLSGNDVGLFQPDVDQTRLRQRERPRWWRTSLETFERTI